MDEKAHIFESEIVKTSRRQKHNKPLSVKTTKLSMEMLNKIAIVCVCLFAGWLLFFVPIYSNYTVNWENKETGMMNITYTSLIPYTKRDTTVQMPKPFAGEIMEHNMYQEDGYTKYITITKVGNYVYTYHSRQAYEYVRQFRDSVNHVILQEAFWPSHYVRSYENPQENPSTSVEE